MYQTTEGERKTYTQLIKSRLVASEEKSSCEKIYQTFHTVRKLNRFGETVKPRKCLVSEKNTQTLTQVLI
jgi:hypothetical protein